METFKKIFLFFFIILGVQAQYDPDRDRQYDRDRYNDPNRTNQNYDHQNPQYDSRYPDQYDRRNNPQYNPYNTTYDRYNQSQYGNQGTYDNRSQYNRDQYNRDQYNRDQYNRDRPYNRDQYGDNRNPQYGSNRDQYHVGNQDPYDRNRNQQYGNRDQYGQNRDQYGQYGQNRDKYGNNRDQYGMNRDQYGGNRDQYGNNRDQYGSNRNQYSTGNRDQQPDFGGPQYGSPIFDANNNCCQDYCYTQDPQPYLNFATKTAYQIAYGKTSNQHKIPDCTPVQFWSINRDGTRYPDARAIFRLRGLLKIQSEIIRNYDDRRSFPDRGRLCPGDLDLFRRWRWNDTISEDRANALTMQGVDDLKYLARRYSSKFEELLREPASSSSYSFQYAETDRAHDSYQAYIEGLFKEQAYNVHANVYNDNRITKPTYSCNTWLREVDGNPSTFNEYIRFKQKPEYQQMVRDVFRRLGFRYTLNDSILFDMYDMCRYEKAWNLNQPSPWCIVFNKDQLKLLEYAEDLKYYYRSGYGSNVNARVGCAPLKDLYEKFERTVNGETNGNKVSVFFTHSETILTFLTAMGIAKDYQPLTADNYYTQNNRQWSTSKIDPFASNLVATLYQCRTGETYRVMFFLNEVPVNYPDCSVGLCNWSTVKNKFQYAAENCNSDFCDHNDVATIQHSFIVYAISLIAILWSLRC